MARFIQFRTESNDGERPYLITLNVNDIKEIKTQWGSQNVYLEVNGIRMKGSYEQLLELLSCHNEAQEIELLNKHRDVGLQDFKVIRA